ncbi:hypothetical protein QQF64_019729 [Cirrhinus molitorella]|uniref:Uncharacterized protein n=1 Tax=Cirrhinus molitorella TaxID=172907 RepID=A0ABR3LGG0_9TELE
MGQASALCGSGPMSAEVRWRMRLWGKQVERTEESDKRYGSFLSELLDQDVAEEGIELVSLPSLPAPHMGNFWRLWPMPQRLEMRARDERSLMAGWDFCLDITVTIEREHLVLWDRPF